jgi:uncharacterized membrane protein YkoI
MRWYGAVFAFGLCVAMTNPIAWAGHDGHGRRDQDEARAALENGAIRPFEQMLAAVHERVPGDVVKVRLERDAGRWLYEFRVIDRQGRLREVVLDAASASVIGVEDN